MKDNEDAEMYDRRIMSKSIKGVIRLLFVAALALLILAGTCAAVSLSNSGGGTWKYQHIININDVMRHI
jgi:hypothetical protein